MAGVPLGKLLTALNRKLEAYLDRDHQIGHSYFKPLLPVFPLLPHPFRRAHLRSAGGVVTVAG